MRMINAVISIMILLAGVFGCAKQEKKTWDGPFGLQEGILFQDFIKDYKVTDAQPGKLIYEAREVPRPDERFTHYQLWFEPDAGLCKIVAQGKILNVSEDGHQLKEHYQNIAEALVAQYGQMTDDFDFLKVDSALTAPDQWMMGLLVKERILAGYWEQGKGKRGGDQAVLQLPNGLKTVMINARAYSPTSAGVDVEYEFSNFERCELAIRVAEMGL